MTMHLAPEHLRKKQSSKVCHNYCVEQWMLLFVVSNKKWKKAVWPCETKLDDCAHQNHIINLCIDTI